MINNRFCNLAMALGVSLILTTPAAFAADYKLGVSDRLKIKVQEWSDLNGEYTVTADGVVALPLIGNIKVVGLSVDDVSNQISDRLQQRSEGAERPLAAIEIAQYRPFTIVGDVQRPGEYPYRPGITVLQAISIAGGYYRPEIGLLRLDRDIALAKGDIRTLQIRQTRLIARAARLTAALAGQEDFQLPPELSDQKDNASIADILRSERSTLEQDNDQVRSETSTFEAIKSLYLNEITSLRGQLAALSQEEDTIQTQLNQFRSLSAKGLALMPTLFSLERSVAQIANEKKNVETSVVRAQENVALAEQRLHERLAEKNRTDMRDLKEANDELAQVRMRIRTAGDLLTEAQITAPAEARERLAQLGQHDSFTLLRKEGDQTREIAVDESTLVSPGDVIRVPMVRTNREVSSSGLTNLSRAEGPEQQR